MKASHGLSCRQTERSENAAVLTMSWKDKHSGAGRLCKRSRLRPRCEQEPSAWQQMTCLQLVCKHGVHGQKKKRCAGAPLFMQAKESYDASATCDKTREGPRSTPTRKKKASQRIDE